MERTVQVLKALAEPTRLRIVSLCLAGGDLAVSEFVRILGQSQPRVSRHLKLLTDAGVLTRIPEGSWVFYRISADGWASVAVESLVKSMPDDETTLSRDRERLAAVKTERAQAADAYFSANAESWNELRAMHIDQAEVNAALLKVFGDTDVDGLLDIGTGTGEMLKLFAGHIRRGEGVDLSRDMLGVARSSLEAAGLTHCHVRQGDLYSLPYEDASFDVVVVHQVLHYVDDVASALIEASRVLAPDGRMIIADFARHEVEDLRTQQQHRRLGFNDTDLDTSFERAGLHREQLHHLGGKPLTVAIWLALKPEESLKAETAA